MSVGMIDCDLHINLPGTAVLLPYLEPYWQEQVTVRAIDRLDITTYPTKPPLYARADWRREGEKPGTSLNLLCSEAFDRLGATIGIANVVYGSQTVFHPDLAAAFCRATNDWLAEHWLSAEPRLRASIVVPVQEPELAAQEIERRAEDRRFVQVLMLASADMPLGKRYYWPIYRAAARHGLPVAIHAGNGGRFASTYAGWPSFYVEEYSAQAQTFQGQLLSLVYQGVFQEFPDLTIVLAETGVTWLPSFLSRADNTWRALRSEVPWVDRAPSDIVRERVRMTAQPFDCPASPGTVQAIVEQIGSDRMLLYASDYPHWQFDGDDPLPAGLSPELVRRITVDNPLDTYPRLKETQS